MQVGPNYMSGSVYCNKVKLTKDYLTFIFVFADFEHDFGREELNNRFPAAH